MHGLDPGLVWASCWFSFPKYILVYSPTQYLAVCSNGSSFSHKPFLAYWRPNTSVQVNNTSALHRIHTDTHIYITSKLLFILFFTLLPLLLASRLPLTLPVGHNDSVNYYTVLFCLKVRSSRICQVSKEVFISGIFCTLNKTPPSNLKKTFSAAKDKKIWFIHIHWEPPAMKW